jgi:hypothetical protein
LKIYEAHSRAESGNEVEFRSGSKGREENGISKHVNFPIDRQPRLKLRGVLRLGRELHHYGVFVFIPRGTATEKDQISGFGILNPMNLAGRNHDRITRSDIPIHVGKMHDPLPLQNVINLLCAGMIMG